MIGQKQKEFLLKALPKPFIFALKRIQLKGREEKDYLEWERSGKTPPAPHRYKQEILRDYGKRFHLKTLVETGTFLGLMMEAQIPNFENLISIELDPDLFKAATKRFSRNPSVKIIQGDSGEMISKVVQQLKVPALFWLDGHYSGGFTAKGKSECPIYDELRSILASPLPHVILIDDARCFVGESDYPTGAEVTDFISKLNPNLSVHVLNDVIRVEPKA